MGFSLLLGLLFQGAGEPFFTEDSTRYLVRNYSIEDGFPVNAVNGIVQNDDGYLFFSTLDGLVRYDGYNFVTFNSSNSPGLSNNRLARIFQSNSGATWLVGEGGEVIRYQNHHFTTYSLAKGNTGRKIALKETPSGQLWAGTNSGLAVFRDPTGQFFFPKDTLLTAPVMAIEPTGKNEGWIVNRYGLVRWHQNSAEIRLPSSEFPIAAHQINQLIADSRGRLWLIGIHGLFCIQSGAGQTNILWGLSGELILLGDNEVVIDGKVVFENEEIQAGFVDREGSIWVATRTQGIFQIRKSIIRNITATEQYPVSNVYPIIQTADSTIWAASLQGGIFQFKGSGIRSMKDSSGGIRMVFTRSLYEDTDGMIYAGLEGRGLWKYSVPENSWEKVEGFDRSIEYQQSIIRAIYRDRSGRLILGLHGPARILIEDSVQLLRDAGGQTLSRVRVIREDKNGILYLGTNGNGLAMLPPDGTFQIIGTEEGLASNYIRDIFLQSRDTVWTATENEGLSRLVFDSEGSVSSIVNITAEDGLIDNFLHRIIRGPYNYFWISSNSGIMRISKTELNAFADGRSNSLPLISFDERDGMLNREANGGVQSAGILTADNKLWFPNQTGITVLDPAAPGIREELPVPKPVIQQIRMEDSLITLTDLTSIHIPKGRRNLGFKFTAPNFANPDQIQFKYRLSEVNQDWQFSNQALEASYTNLDPGTYRFEVAAERVNGNQAVTGVAITVPPFFYETTWFYLLMALAGCALLVAGYRYRIGALKRRQATLQKLVDRQTKELQKAAEQKSRFFTGITHELKTPLSLILNPLDEIIENRKNRSGNGDGYYLKMMQRNGYRLQNLVNQILDVSKLNAGAIKLTLRPADLEAFTIQIAGQFQSVLSEKNMALDIQKANIKEPVFVDADAWERIVINLMSNAIKYSPEGSNLILLFKNAEKCVHVHLRDFGAGIADDEQERVFEYLYQAEGDKAAGGTGIGLFLVKELTEHMNGSVELQSDLGEGSEFIITLQKGTSHFHETDIISHEPVALDKTSFAKRNRSAAKTIEEENTEEHAGHLLIVEDSIDFRNYLHSALSDTYHVTAAGDGVEALQIMDQIRPDLVITDLMMPKMNGLEFVQKVRGNKKFKHLPVIFLTAKDSEPDMEAALSTGADIYLTKPIRSRILRSQIMAVLRRERILKQIPEHDGIPGESKFVRDVRQMIFRQMGNTNLNIELLAEALYLSPSKLYRDWKKVSDLTLNEFITRVRMNEAKILLTEKRFSVQEAARAVGYPNPNYFSTRFKKVFGESPSEIS